MIDVSDALYAMKYTTNLLNYLEDDDLMQQLRHKKGKYFGTQSYTTHSCLQDAIVLSKLFGCDTEVVCGIILGMDYSKPAYGEYGERFMKGIDPEYSRVQYAKDIIKKLLFGIETDKRDLICNGIEHVFNREVTTTEEQVADMVKYCYDYADRMPSTVERNMYAIKFMEKTIEKSEELGRVVTLKFPDRNDLELMDPIEYKKERAESLITRFYDYYLEHYDEIPDKFKMGFDGESREKITARYLLTRGEAFIAAKEYEIWKKEKQAREQTGTEANSTEANSLKKNKIDSPKCPNWI